MSFIIPACNEEAELKRSLAALRRCGVPCEVILADGGSTDRTRDVARRFGACVVDTGVRQRAAQMNAGAEFARGELLVFLHADTWLPGNALRRLLRAARNPAIAGGAFRRRFRSSSALLKATCALADGRGRLLGWYLGDQVIWCRRGAFERLGGYRPLDMMEDLDFSRRLKREGRTVLLSPMVLSSARRFRRGPLLRTLKDFLLVMRWLLAFPGGSVHGAANRHSSGTETGRIHVSP